MTMNRGTVFWHIHYGNERDFTLQYNFGAQNGGVLLRKFKQRNVERYPTDYPNPFRMRKVIVKGVDYDL